MPLNLPKTSNGEVVQLVPPVKSLAMTVDNTISSATDLTLNQNTSIVEVTAINAGIYMRYSSTASSSNSDEYILANSTRNYVIPPGVTVLSFIQDASVGTALLRVIEK